MITVVTWIADHHTGGRGKAYMLNTITYRFRPVTGGPWVTVDGHTLSLHAESGHEETVDDPTAPTDTEQLAAMTAWRLAQR